MSSEDRKFSHFKEGSQLGLLFILAPAPACISSVQGGTELAATQATETGVGWPVLGRNDQVPGTREEQSCKKDKGEGLAPPSIEFRTLEEASN